MIIPFLFINYYTLYIPFILIGFCGFPMNGLFVEFACELLFPIGEGAAVGLLQGNGFTSSIFSAVFSVIADNGG